MLEYVKSGDEFAVNDPDPGNQTNPQITPFSDGSFLLTWVDRAPWPEDGQVLMGQLYDVSGARAGDAFQLNQPTDHAVFSQGAVALPGGGFVATWIDNDLSGGAGAVVRARLFDGAGAPLGAEFAVSPPTSGSKFTAEIASLANGGFVITWDDWGTWDKKAQLFDAGGAPVGSEITLNSSLGGRQEYGDVVGLAGGGFVATWRDDSTGLNVEARVFDDAGNALGAEFAVNTLATGNVSEPVLAALADGGFVAVWSTYDTTADGSGNAVKAQIFSATGAPVGGEFLVNQLAAGSQDSPAVTALADGGFIVAWETWDTTQDGSGAALKFRQFAADGTPAGDEMLLNTAAAGSQILPELATLADGRVLAAWAGGPDSSEGDVSAQFLYVDTDAPVITSNGGGDSASVTLAEGETAVAVVAAVDADGPQPVSYSIGGGADAALFSIDSATGELSFVAAPDFESPADADGDNIYEVLVEARDGVAVDSQAIAVTVTDVAGDGLSFAQTALTALENGLEGPTLQAVGGDGSAVGYAIVGGADAALFTLDGDTGALAFVVAQDFEAPADAGGDGTYEVEVIASDATGSVTRTISVALANVNETPTLVSGLAWTVDENEFYVGQLGAHDPENDTIYFLIVGGADEALFSIGDDGTFGFDVQPDFEAPADADGDNVYELEVAVWDGALGSIHTVTVAVADVEQEAPPAFVETAFTVDEDTFTSVPLAATGLDESQPVYFSITGGVDAARFVVTDFYGMIQLLPRDFESPVDADGDGVYEVEVTAHQGFASISATLSFTVADVDEAPVIEWPSMIEAAENGVAVAALAASDPEQAPLEYRIVGGSDASRFTIDRWTGALTFVQTPNFEAPVDADHDNLYQLAVAVFDGNFETVETVQVAVTDVNEAPELLISPVEWVNENRVDVDWVAANDPDGDVLTYFIAGGADAGLFTIDPFGGPLEFLSAPDFEAPADADGDNVYEVEIGVSDGELSDVEAMAVVVDDVAGRTISGSSWSNTLVGTSEEDTLRGLGGNDRLIGGAGADILLGGSGRDEFEFTSIGDSTVAASDRILDFTRGSPSVSDKIDLAAIDANAGIAGNQAFSFIGSAAFSGQEGQLRAVQQGGEILVQGDVNGDGIADLQIFVDGPVSSLVSSDFLL